jgi:hypothetical protein
VLGYYSSPTLHTWPPIADTSDWSSAQNPLATNSVPQSCTKSSPVLIIYFRAQPSHLQSVCSYFPNTPTIPKCAFVLTLTSSVSVFESPLSSAVVQTQHASLTRTFHKFPHLHIRNKEEWNKNKFQRIQKNAILWRHWVGWNRKWSERVRNDIVNRWSLKINQ